ncbi:hypothetical protein, partial [Staphylococcus aureus]
VTRQAFLMIRRPPRSTRVRSSAASDVYKRQVIKRRRNRLFFETSVNEFLLVLILYRNNSILYI